MNRTAKWTATVSALALVVVPTIAQAAPVGTAAGVDITNTVTVDYQVGGVGQTQQQAQDTFTVDRKINLTVATTDTAAISVTPGQEGAVTTFTVTNNSNDTIDFLLAATNQDGGAANFTGTDSFDLDDLTIYVETNGTAGYQEGADTLASSISAIASGDVVTVYVLGDSDITDVDGAYSTVVLTATAAEGVTASTTALSGLPATFTGTGGSAISETPDATANGKLTEETVFADAAYAPSGDAQYNGKHAARSDYVITAAALSVNKYSRVVSDPVGSTNPRAIPGSVIEYCIVVSNATGGATATSVLLSDILPSTMTYETNTVYLNGVFDSVDTCADDAGGADGTDGANVSGNTVSNTFASVAATETVTLRFQAKIN